MTRQDRINKLYVLLEKVDNLTEQLEEARECIKDLEFQLDTPAEMTKGHILAWAELHREEWFAQTILNCWDDEDFENLDEEFFIGLRDAMNEQFRASQQ
jgi:hypothetical protein